MAPFWCSCGARLAPSWPQKVMINIWFHCICTVCYPATWCLMAGDPCEFSSNFLALVWRFSGARLAPFWRASGAPLASKSNEQQNDSLHAHCLLHNHLALDGWRSLSSFCRLSGARLAPFWRSSGARLVLYLLENVKKILIRFHCVCF